MVLLVLEGGPNTIRTVLESVTSTPAVPVVIADGSGRAADILAYAYSLYIEHQGFVFVLIIFFFLCPVGMAVALTGHCWTVHLLKPDSCVIKISLKLGYTLKSFH